MSDRIGSQRPLAEKTVTLRYQCPNCGIVVDLKRNAAELRMVTVCSGGMSINVATGTTTDNWHESTPMLIIGAVGVHGIMSDNFQVAVFVNGRETVEDFTDLDEARRLARDWAKQREAKPEAHIGPVVLWRVEVLEIF